MNPTKILLLLSLVFMALSAVTLPFSTSQLNKHGIAYSSASCNANTVIDFSFSSASTLTFGTDLVTIV